LRWLLTPRLAALHLASSWTLYVVTFAVVIAQLEASITNHSA